MSRLLEKGVRAAFVLALLLATSVVTSAQSGLEKSEITIDIPSVQGSAAIDGVLNDNVWNNAARISIPVILYGTVEDADLSGEALVFWNASGLHVGVRVTDDQLLAAGANDNLWAYDSVSIWLNNLWVQVGLDQDDNPRVRLDYLAGFPSFESSYEVGISQSESGYVIELMVPAAVLESALGLEWAAGAEFAYAVGLSDRDEGDRTAASPRYFPNWFGWNNVESMSTATLK